MKPRKIVLLGAPPSVEATLQTMLLQNNVRIISEPHFSDGLSGKYDILLLFQPAHDLEALEQVSALRQQFPAAPVVVVSERGTPHGVAQAFRLGASDLLLMPLDEEAVQNTLRRHLFSTGKNVKRGWWQRWLPFLKNKSDLAINGISATQPAPCVACIEEAPNVQVQLFGKLKLIVNGKETGHLSGRRTRSVLAALLHAHPKPVHREILMEKFWGNVSESSARNCLNVTLHSIRTSIREVAGDEKVIVYNDECYGLNPDLKVERDIDYFEMYWKKGQKKEIENGLPSAIDTYHQAFAFYRGDFLEDLLFQEWTHSVRENYREVWLYLLDRLGQHFFEKERLQLCKNLCQKMLRVDPCLENVHRRLMSCYLRLGMRDSALRQYQKCQSALENELSIRPRQATIELYRRIRAA